MPLGARPKPSQSPYGSRCCRMTALDSVLGCFASRKFRIKPMGTPPGRRRALPRTLPDAAGRLPERTETRNSWRQNALDPGFHGVPAGPIHPNRAADGAGVTGVRYGVSAAARTTNEPPAPMVSVGTAVPVRAVVLKRVANPFGSPAVPSDLPSDSAVRRPRPCRPQARTVPSAGPGRAIRGLQPCHTQVLVSCGRRFRWVLG